MRLLLLLGSVACARPAGLNLLAVGDWGGHNDAQPTTPGQVAAAKGMAKTAAAISAEGVLLLGDNFYTHGVANVSSSRFKDTFEDVYAPAAFGSLPFHVVAGNHDHKGNVQAQLDYSGHDERWNFPSLYYKLPFRFTSSSGVERTAEFIMIDTVSLVGISDDDCRGCALPGAPDVAAAEDQWVWIAQALAASTADFLWVAGHYPVYSAGADGTTPELVDRLLPLLKQHGAHYIGGHDHMHEHIEYEGVHMVVTGPGMECCYAASKNDTVPPGAIKYILAGPDPPPTRPPAFPTPPVLGGFSSLTFDDDLRIALRREDGGVLYELPRIAPRGEE